MFGQGENLCHLKTEFFRSLIMELIFVILWDVLLLWFHSFSREEQFQVFLHGPNLCYIFELMRQGANVRTLLVAMYVYFDYSLRETGEIK